MWKSEHAERRRRTAGKATSVIPGLSGLPEECKRNQDRTSNGLGYTAVKTHPDGQRLYSPRTPMVVDHQLDRADQRARNSGITMTRSTTFRPHFSPLEFESDHKSTCCFCVIVVRSPPGARLWPCQEDQDCALRNHKNIS
jgi:hypothetical protein